MNRSVVVFLAGGKHLLQRDHDGHHDLLVLQLDLLYNTSENTDVTICHSDYTISAWQFP